MNKKLNIFWLIVLFIVSIGISSYEEKFNILPSRIYQSVVYPCSNCHDSKEVNLQRRQLQFHTDIKLKGHAEAQRWCLDCHDANDRNKLKLLNGEKISFNELYRLCGQCHGNIYKDWKAGVHGKRIGSWNGNKKYLLCTYCHNPHNPRFNPIVPETSPKRPEETLIK